MLSAKTDRVALKGVYSDILLIALVILKELLGGEL
jgi:hypothetical protein